MERGDLKEYRRVRREGAGGNNLIHSSYIAPDGGRVTYFEDVTRENGDAKRVQTHSGEA